MTRITDIVNHIESLPLDSKLKIYRLHSLDKDIKRSNAERTRILDALYKSLGSKDLQYLRKKLKEITDDYTDG